MALSTIAVFTKNLTNPAYAAARMGADRTAQRMGRMLLRVNGQLAASCIDDIRPCADY